MAEPFYTLGQEGHPSGGNWLRDAVFGLNDGLVSNFALVAGVAGAGPKSGVVLLAGLAGLAAGAASMSIGAYISGKSQREYYRSEEYRERAEVAACPEAEEEEVRRIYRAKGLSGDLLEKVVAVFTADKERWVDLMMSEELGLAKITGSPVQGALIMGVAFAVGALVPVLPFWLLAGGTGLEASLVLSASALFAVGAGRTRYTRQNPLWGGCEMVLAGGGAGAIAWGLGHLLGQGGLGG